tara:strand:+ start:363 stop:1070 length:708 start_codon:yes stop_codon:yes gene_type:complete
VEIALPPKRTSFLDPRPFPNFFLVIFVAMKNRKAFLLLNGAEPSLLPDLGSYQFICAADGAYNVLKSKDIAPDLVVGDFDSIGAIPAAIETVHRPDQNLTDFDKALALLKERGFLNIDVYGASGKEHDHFLGNISTAIQWKDLLNITFFDDFGSYFFSEKTLELKAVKGKTISLIPFPTVHKIFTKGLAYPLQEETLTFGKRIGTRNKAIEDKVHISFESGDLLIYVGTLKKPLF